MRQPQPQPQPQSFAGELAMPILTKRAVDRAAIAMAVFALLGDVAESVAGRKDVTEHVPHKQPKVIAPDCRISPDDRHRWMFCDVPEKPDVTA